MVLPGLPFSTPQINKGEYKNAAPVNHFIAPGHGKRYVLYFYKIPGVNKVNSNGKYFNE